MDNEKRLKGIKMKKKLNIGRRSKKIIMSMAFLTVSALSFASGEDYYDYK